MRCRASHLRGLSLRNFKPLAVRRWTIHLRQLPACPVAKLTSTVTVEQGTFFKLLDGYARRQHRCFLAEMDLNAARGHYSLCFRPTGVVDENSPNLYACRYLYVGVDEVGIAGQTNTLPTSVTEMLDRELPSLPQS